MFIYFFKIMKHPERDRLAAILRDLQDSSGCQSASELARKIGIPEQRFRSYMRGQNTAQGESLEKIEAFMGLKSGELWERLYKDDEAIRSATELVPLFNKLTQSEKKRFLQLAMEAL
jgi:hypothetical protein